METCLAKSKDINLVYSINEPSGGGGAEALNAAGVKATIVSVDGGCDPGLKLVKDGTIGATSQQYPVKMAQLGVEAIAKFKTTGEKPAGYARPGLLRHRRGAGDRQEGRRPREHQCRRRREALLGLSKPQLKDKAAGSAPYRRLARPAGRSQPVTAAATVASSRNRSNSYGKEAHVTTSVEPQAPAYRR